MITSLSKHAPERHTAPSRAHGIASLCLAMQQAELRSLTTSYGLSGQSGSMLAPGLIAIAGRKAIVRLIEGVLRSLRGLTQVRSANRHLRLEGHGERNAVLSQGLNDAAVTVHFDNGIGDADFGSVRGVKFNSVLGDDGHVIAPFCFLTYGNGYRNASASCLTLGNFFSIEVRG